MLTVTSTATSAATSTATPSALPATDLGYLLHKHPDRVQRFDVGTGTAHVFYPRADAAKCTATLLLEIDPDAPALRGGRPVERATDPRPWAAGSLLAVAIAAVFGSALRGRCDARPDLVDARLALSVHLPTLPAPGGPAQVRELFAPMGWTVDAEAVPVDPQVSWWGPSRWVDARLTGRMRLADALAHLYLLLPVLDGAKHYFVGEHEVEKLLRFGGGWLVEHPQRELITRRYLAHQRAYVQAALGSGTDGERDGTDPDGAGAAVGGMAAARRAAVHAELRTAGARRVLDLGCGSGALLRELATDPTFTEIVGTDVAPGALAAAGRALERLPDLPRARVVLRQSALTYQDGSLHGYDAAVLMEVVEHLDPQRLPALERAVFAAARPTTVIVTTPNAEYNVRYPALAAGGLRHADHRFEWTRAEFAAWTDGVGARHGYRTRHVPVGPVDPQLGASTQLAVLTRIDGSIDDSTDTTTEGER